LALNVGDQRPTDFRQQFTHMSIIEPTRSAEP
jgi:hypothetical protein